MTSRSKILVTGGCGYIGSHVCAQLSQEGYEVIVLDDLSTGVREALLHGEKLIVGDFGDRQVLTSIFKEHSIQAVFHFAASIVVADSVKKPFEYYENNSIKFYSLLREVESAGIKKFILSSTAAVYGARNDFKAVKEEDPLAPLSPYGRSKVFDEWLLEDVSKVSNMQYVMLRYFNVAGSGANGKLGQRGKGTHLIKIACETALNLRKNMNIFGNDFATKDGTCIRDYIHVEDLATAHISAFNYLLKGGKNLILNCGYNRGYSVREVLNSFEKLIGRKLSITETSRRAGDLPFLVADTELISKTLDWKPRYDSLELILKSAWAWEQSQVNHV